MTRRELRLLQLRLEQLKRVCMADGLLEEVDPVETDRRIDAVNNAKEVVALLLVDAEDRDSDESE